ncbi:hypothetical protein ACFMB7_25765 [Bacillus toyonensis]
MKIFKKLAIVIPLVAILATGALGGPTSSFADTNERPELISGGTYQLITALNDSSVAQLTFPQRLVKLAQNGVWQPKWFSGSICK